MDKKKEHLVISDLLRYLGNWSIVSSDESPDFVIENFFTKAHVGVEVTEYFPHRTLKGTALVKIPGKDEAETRANRLRYFEKTDFGYARFAPRLNVDDLYSSRVAVKERKLARYKALAPDCQEFWLLVMLNFDDDVVYENIPSITTTFDRIFVWEEPHTVNELPISKSNER